MKRSLITGSGGQDESYLAEGKRGVESVGLRRLSGES